MARLETLGMMIALAAIAGNIFARAYATGRDLRGVATDDRVIPAFTALSGLAGSGLAAFALGLSG